MSHVVTVPSELLLLAEQNPAAILRHPPKPEASALYCRAVWRALLTGLGEEAALAEGKRVADRLGAKVGANWAKTALENRMPGDYNRVSHDRIDPTGWHLHLDGTRFEGEPELVVRRERVVNVYVNRPFPEQQKPDQLALEAAFLGVMALELVPTPDKHKPISEAMVHLRTHKPGEGPSTEYVAVVRGAGAYFETKKRLAAIAEAFKALTEPAPTEVPAESEAGDA